MEPRCADRLLRPGEGDPGRGEPREPGVHRRRRGPRGRARRLRGDAEVLEGRSRPGVRPGALG